MPFSITDYEAVAASQTDQVLGPTGAKGDILERLIITITTSGVNGIVSIKDGSGSGISIAPASTPVGVFSVEVKARSRDGAWKVTTGSAASVLAVGSFT